MGTIKKRVIQMLEPLVVFVSTATLYISCCLFMDCVEEYRYDYDTDEPTE